MLLARVAGLRAARAGLRRGAAAAPFRSWSHLAVPKSGDAASRLAGRSSAAVAPSSLVFRPLRRGFLRWFNRQNIASLEAEASLHKHDAQMQLRLMRELVRTEPEAAVARFESNRCHAPLPRCLATSLHCCLSVAYVSYGSCGCLCDIPLVLVALTCV